MPLRDVTQSSIRRWPLTRSSTRARLTLYPPGLRQPSHSHEVPHVSIIVAGGIREISSGRDEIGQALQLHVRPCEATHRVEFGPQGALVLAVDVEPGATSETPGGWVYRDLSRVQRKLLRCVLTEGFDADADTDMDDLIGELPAEIATEPLRGSPPGWLMHARERMTDDPAGMCIGALARDAGVHRAHFARAFHHWFKVSPSVFRRHAMLSHAIAAVAAGQSLALAAHCAGFSDQSHLCRTMRSLIGATPRRLLRRV